jgi:integrase
MQSRAESLEVNREEGWGADYDTLARIPDLIRKEAESVRNGEERKKATLIRDQLLIKLLLVLAWRQKNVRECKLLNKKDGGNIFKEEISPLSRIALPKSAKEALEKDPHQKIWQFYFRGGETKAGRAVHAIVPKQLVPLLEEYVSVYRPRLIGNSDPGTLFVNDHGRPFETSAIRVRVKNLTARYAGKTVKPHQFRHAFAFKWLKDHPEDYLTLSKHLWHRDVKVTIRIYGSDFDESYAACRVEDWFGG